MSKKEKLPAYQKLLSVIIGMLVCGLMWRARGSRGFGSFWGLCAVGTVLTLFIYAVYGGRRKLKYELIPVGTFMMGAAVTGYGTIITQPAGIFEADTVVDGVRVFETSPIDPNSGMVILFIMGFTLTALFSVYVGTLFSDREYHIYHYAIIIAFFFAVSLAMRASLAHNIMAAICPDQTALAQEGLSRFGVDMSIKDAYLAHFSSTKWSQQFFYVESYFMCIENISNCVAALVTELFMLVVFKDKIACFSGFFINLSVAVGTCACEYFQVAPYKSGFFGDAEPPRFLENGNWGLWEYGIGVFLGLGTMLFIALLPDRCTNQKPIKIEKPLIENKIVRYLYFTASFVFVFAVVPSRALGEALKKTLGEYASLKKLGKTLSPVIIIVFSVAAALFMFVFFARRIIKNGNAWPVAREPASFAKIMFPAYAGFCGVLYLTVCDPLWQNIPMVAGLEGGFLYNTVSCEGIIMTVTTVTFVLAAVLWVVFRMTGNKKAGIK